MNYIIKMMSGENITVSKEIRDRLVMETGLCQIQSLDIAINISSISTIIPEAQVKVDEMKLYDGTIAKLKGGTWVDKFSGVKLDAGYYKELRETNKLTVI